MSGEARHAWAGRVATKDDPLRVAICISGTGTNMLALLDAFAATRRARGGRVRSEPAPPPGGPWAAARGVPTLCLDPTQYPGRAAYQQAMADALAGSGAELVCLAGFMRLVRTPVLDAFPDRILNIHPSLLPAFPGVDGQKQALDYGVKITGCTVHFATAGMDEGPIILQAAVAVRDDDTLESLTARILTEEHRIYPGAVALFAAGQLYIEGRKVSIRW